MFLKRFLTIENSAGGYRYDTKRFRRFFYYVYKSRGTYLCYNSFAFILNKMRFIFSYAKLFFLATFLFLQDFISRLLIK